MADDWTRGPWVMYEAPSRFGIRTDYAVAPYGGDVVVATTSITPQSARCNEGRANARLIAAVPELYAALEALVKAGDGHSDFEDEWPAARAALAKARGDAGKFMRGGEPG